MRQNALHNFRPIMAAFLLLASITGSYAADLITMVPGEELLRQTFGVRAEYDGVTRWGVRYSLFQVTKPIGRIIIGVFSSSNHAKKLFDDRIRHVSVPPTNVDATIGDNEAEWDDRCIVFVRNNVLVELQLPSTDIEHKARTIDDALRDGLAGVKKGSNVNVPILEGLEYGASGWKATVISEVSGYTALADNSGNDTRSEHVATEVYFATESCVMAEPLKCDRSYLTARREAAKIKDKKDKELAPEAQRQQVAEATATLLDKGSSPYHRNKAVVALGNSGDESVAPTLLAELEGECDPVVKQNTIAALGRLRAKQAVSHLLKMLDSPITGNVSDEGEWEAIFRREAAKALGRIGDSSAVVTLKKVVDASREYQCVRDAANSAIRNIGGK
jgi:hypothetical protein